MAFPATLLGSITLGIFDRDIDKQRLIGPADSAREIADRVKRSCDNFGLLVDLNHLPLLRESPEEALLPVQDHLAHVSHR